MLKPACRIKICGITRTKDAMYAAELGVDAVGFVLAESPRRVAPEAAREMSLSLPPFVSTVGVVVDMSLDALRETAAFCRLDWLQLHGNESPEYCQALDLRIIKAFRVEDQQSIEKMAPYEGHVHAFLLDAYVKGKKGGTGKTFDWNLAKRAMAHGPVILSGGLTPERVREAIHIVRPWGLDVSSGVESAPGIKDHKRMRSFVEEVRQSMGGTG